MRRKLLLTILITTLTALMCVAQDMAESNSSNFEVKIKIIRNTKNKFADNNEFIPRKGAHIVIEICTMPRFMADVNCNHHSRHRLPYQKLPAVVLIKGDFNSQKTKYRLSASVINSKEKSAIAGDLVSEIQTWLRPNKITEIEVFGLEYCTAKNAGGFCASKVRK